jgi:hypothetical protein
MKICKDCKYSVPDKAFDSFPFWPWQKREHTRNSWKFAKCCHPKVLKSDYPMVSGCEVEPEMACVSVRHLHEWKPEEWCGPDAKWYEPRATDK